MNEEDHSVGATPTYVAIKGLVHRIYVFYRLVYYNRHTNLGSHKERIAFVHFLALECAADIMVWCPNRAGKFWIAAKI